VAQPRGRRQPWLSLAGSGVVLAIALVATRPGLGISADSAAYLAEARSLRTTGSVGVPAGIYGIYADVEADPDRVTGTHFPPLYPLASP
jgi:hypothetical protein